MGGCTAGWEMNDNQMAPPMASKWASNCGRRRVRRSQTGKEFYVIPPPVPGRGPNGSVTWSLLRMSLWFAHAGQEAHLHDRGGLTWLWRGGQHGDRQHRERRVAPFSAVQRAL